MSFPTYVTVPFDRTMILSCRWSYLSRLPPASTASPSSPPFSPRSRTGSHRSSSAARTPHPRISGEESRSRAPAVRIRFPAAPSSADGSLRSRPPQRPPLRPLRPGLPRSPAAFRRAALQPALCLPRRIASPACTNPSSNSRSAARAPAFSRQQVHAHRRALLQVQKPDHHVRDLHARIVDVVLHLNVFARVAQDARQRVP